MIINILELSHTISLHYNFQTTIIMTAKNNDYTNNYQQQLHQQLATTTIIIVIITISQFSRQFTSQQINNKYNITIHFTSSYSTTVIVTV